LSADENAQLCIKPPNDAIWALDIFLPLAPRGMLDGTPGNVTDLLDAYRLMMEQQVEQYSVTVNIVSNLLTQLGHIQEVGRWGDKSSFPHEAVFSFVVCPIGFVVDNTPF
jgi:hypothetical protein